MKTRVEQQLRGSPPLNSFGVVRDFNVSFAFQFFPRQQRAAHLMLDNCTAALGAPSNSNKSLAFNACIALLLADNGWELL